MTNARYTRFLGASLVALCAMQGNAAHAQAAADAGQPPAATDASEIVVTGLKRNTGLLDAPVSVSVFAQDAIEKSGIVKPTDFLTQTPNVNITTSINPGDFMINMRGQSTVRGAEPTVAVVIDGVYAGTPAEFNTALFDLQQIEVLKGPQGAYYGRNASAGAIIITTKKPSDTFEGNGLFSFGNNNEYNAQASISGPIIKGKLAARLGVSFKGSDGSYTNVVTGEKSQRYSEKAGRFRLVYDDGGPFTADLRLTAVRGSGASHYFTAKIAAVPGLSPDGTVVGGVPVTDISASHNLNVPYVTDVPGVYDRKVYSAALKLDYDLGFATLTSTTGYSKTHEQMQGKNYPYFSVSDGSTDYGGWGPVFGDKLQANEIRNTQFQQELRLTSKNGGFVEWQAGAQFISFKKDYSLMNALNGAIPDSIKNDPAALIGYNGYSMVDGTMTRTLIGGGVPLPYPFQIYGTDTPYAITNFQTDRFQARNIAPFANVKINFTKALSLSLAGRYDIEKRKVKAIGPAEINPFTGKSYNPCVSITGQSAAECAAGISKTFKQFQPKATLAYAFSDGSVYASWGRSFKSGGFNPIGTREQTVQGITAQNVALGMDPVAARAAAESSVITQDFYRKEVSTTYEVGAKASLFDKRLYVNAAVFHTDIKNGQLYVFDPVVYVQSIQSIDKIRVKGFEIDANFKVTDTFKVFGGYGLIDAKIKAIASSPAAVGNTPPYVAKNTLNLGAQLDQPISDTKTLLARVDYQRMGKTYYSLDNDPGYVRSPYDLVNARLGLETDRFTFSIYGKNIFDKRYVTEIAPIITGAATAYALAEGKTYGAEVRVRF